MLATTQWPLERAVHLTSLVRVCVLWLPESLMDLSALWDCIRREIFWAFLGDWEKILVWNTVTDIIAIKVRFSFSFFTVFSHSRSFACREQTILITVIDFKFITKFLPLRLWSDNYNAVAQWQTHCPLSLSYYYSIQLKNIYCHKYINIYNIYEYMYTYSATMGARIDCYTILAW